jgi:hypothetical protein
MNAKHGNAGAVLLVLLGGALATAQGPQNLPGMNQAALLVPPLDPAPGASMPAYSAPADSAPASPMLASPAPAPLSVPDPWLLHQQPEPFNQGCCGPIGRDGPIGWEVYARGGPSFVYSNTAYAKSLNTGIEAEGGWRTLFFNKDADRAWIIDLNLVYTYNDGHPQNSFTLADSPVTLRNLHRTAVGLGFGHDWFVFGPGSVGRYCDTNIRYGFEAGARWGTQHLDLNIVGTNDGYLRHQDGFGEAYAGIHFDMDIPMGGWTFFTGFSSEFVYTFSGAIIPNVNTNLHELNTMLTAGVRY